MPDDQTNISFAPPLPEAVRRAAERAEQLAREANMANTGADGAGEGVQPGDNSGGEPRPSEPQTPVPSQEPPLAPVPEPVAQPVDEWQQRYHTLQGKYNTEVPELRGQIASLRDLITTMQQAPRREPDPPARPHAAMPPEVIPQEDVEAYGQDLITAAQRWAEARVRPMMAEFERRLVSVEGGTQRVETRTNTQTVEQALDATVPSWREVNVDPRFVQWLAQQDPFSGMVRQDLITRAHVSGDAARTIAFFRAYLNEHTTVSQAQPGTQSFQTPDPGAERLPLADLAVPGRGQTATLTPGAPERRIWTTAQIAAFYREKQRGLWSNREVEADRIERDIVAAGTEGRVRQ